MIQKKLYGILTAALVAFAGCNMFNASIDGFLDGNVPEDYGPSFAKVADFAAWLASLGPNDPASAYTYPGVLDVSFRNINVLIALDTVIRSNNSDPDPNGPRKYLTLDLSRCRGITVWNTNALATSSNYITTLILPDTVTTLAYRAFWPGYDNLARVSGVGVTTAGQEAFWYCTDLVSASFPALTSIGQQAFSHCPDLATVNCPALTSLGDRAFEYGSNLSSLFLPASPPVLGSDVFYNTSSANITIHVPGGPAMIATYEAVWGVTSPVPVGSLPGILGDNHGAITIVSP